MLLDLYYIFHSFALVFFFNSQTLLPIATRQDTAREYHASCCPRTLCKMEASVSCVAASAAGGQAWESAPGHAGLHSMPQALPDLGEAVAAAAFSKDEISFIYLQVSKNILLSLRRNTSYQM